jgi:hypothetical protein
MTVVPMPSQEPSQLVLEGFPEPEGLRFTLASARNLPTDRELGFHQHVTGTFKGHVTGVRYVEKGDGAVLVYEITVLEAELDR